MDSKSKDLKQRLIFKAFESLLLYELRSFKRYSRFKQILIVLKLILKPRIRHIYTNKTQSNLLYFCESEHLYNPDLVFLSKGDEKYKNLKILSLLKRSGFSKITLVNKKYYRLINLQELKEDYIFNFFIKITIKKYLPLLDFLEIFLNESAFKEFITNDPLSPVARFISFSLNEKQSSTSVIIDTEVTELSIEHKQLDKSQVYVNKIFENNFQKFIGIEYSGFTYQKDVKGDNSIICFDLLFLSQYYVNYGIFKSRIDFIVKNIVLIYRISKNKKVLLRYHPHLPYLEKFLFRLASLNRHVSISNNKELEKDFSLCHYAISFNSSAAEKFTAHTKRKHFNLK